MAKNKRIVDTARHGNGGLPAHPKARPVENDNIVSGELTAEPTYRLRAAALLLIEYVVSHDHLQAEGPALDNTADAVVEAA